MDGLAPGQLLRGKYRVERVLGTGGMGVVVKATHLRLAKPVAIKMLRPEARGRADVAERFAREARAASSLRGEHAVRILDVDDSEAGDPFLVMEYLDGTDAQELVAKEGPLPIETAIAYLLQACEGIAEAHAAGIVHRDLKPANLFVTTRPDGSPLVKLLDFGISKLPDPDERPGFAITQEGVAVGSPAYMSPEQIKNAGDVDARTDVWALGVVCFHLLTKALPFEATTTASLAARIAADPPRDIRELRADVPDALAAIIRRCLEKDRNDRFADVAALAGALAAHAPDHASGAARIARVVSASPRKEEETAGEARATGPETMELGRDDLLAAAPAPAPGATASIHDLTLDAKAPTAVETEYGSTRSADGPEKPKARWPKPLALFALLLAGGGVLLFVRSRAPSSSNVEGSSHGASGTTSVASAPSSTKTSVETPPLTASSPEPSSTTASEATPSSTARPPATTKRPASPPTKPTGTAAKNPLDLPFR